MDRSQNYRPLSHRLQNWKICILIHFCKLTHFSGTLLITVGYVLISVQSQRMSVSWLKLVSYVFQRGGHIWELGEDLYEGVVLKGKDIWQKINPLAFQLILRYQRGWGWLGLDSEWCPIQRYKSGHIQYILNYLDYGCTDSAMYFQSSCIQWTITARLKEFGRVQQTITARF